MTKSRWMRVVGMYLLWVITIALGFWLLLVSREAFLMGAAFYVGDDIVRGWQVRFLDKAVFIAAGLFVIILFTLTEGYLRGGLEKQDLFKRFAKITGIELLLIFVFDILLVLMQGATAGSWLRWLIVFIELALGIAFFRIGRSATKIQLGEGN